MCHVPTSSWLLPQPEISLISGPTGKLLDIFKTNFCAPFLWTFPKALAHLGQIWSLFAFYTPTALSTYPIAISIYGYNICNDFRTSHNRWDMNEKQSGYKWAIKGTLYKEFWSQSGNKIHLNLYITLSIFSLSLSVPKWKYMYIYVHFF